MPGKGFSLTFPFSLRRDEPLTIKTKYLVYKGCKKNVHRLWKLNGDKGKSAASSSGHSGKYAKSGSLFGAGLNGRDDEKIKRITDQTIQENIRTTEKMNQLRLKMELANARKKLKSIKFPVKSKSKAVDEKAPKKIDVLSKELHENGVEKPMCKSKDQFNDKVIQRQLKQERYLSAESKMKIKENLSRNRSFKTILSPPALASSSSMSFFNNDMNPLEFCFSGSTGDVLGPGSNKLGRSLSFQSNYVFNRTDSNLCVNNASGVNSLATMEAATISNSTPIIQEYVGPICEPERARAIGTKVKDVKKPAYSTSMQDLLLKEFLTKSTPGGYHVGPTATVQSRDYSSANMEFASFKKSTRESAFNNRNDEKDVLKGAKAGPAGEINEYFILPKLLIREDSPSVFEAPLDVDEQKTDVAGAPADLLDVATAKQPSAESLIEFYDNLTSSSTSSLVSKLNDYGCFPSFHQPSNRFYHSDLDLNQLNDRFKNKLSISNQDINTSDGNLGADSDWSRSNLLLLSAINQTKDEPAGENNIIEDVNYDKFLNDLLSNDFGSTIPCTPVVESEKDEASGVSKAYAKDNEIDLFGSDLDSTLLKKTSARRIPPLKKPSDKLKSFGSNPTLLGHHSLSTHESSNLTATTTTSTTTVHIPQLSRLDAIPTKYRRGELRRFRMVSNLLLTLFIPGYINLNDACLSNSDLTSSSKLPRPSSERKPMMKEPNSFHHGGSVFHYRSHQQRDFDIPEINDRIPPTDGARNDSAASGSSGRQSRFEYCNSYYSNLSQYAPSAHHRNTSKATSAFVAPPYEPDGASNFDFQSEENLFNMNFDSFYEDFVDSAELSWSSTSSASSTSFESSSISSIYDKKYVILPEIKLDNEAIELEKPDGEKALLVAKEETTVESQQQKESSGKLRCFHCNKKLGIIMIMKCHCNQYFCSAHRYMEVHNCSYNYKLEGKKKLERENPLVGAKKLPKI